MKNLKDKTLIFYTFQLQQTNDYNMTYIDKKETLNIYNILQCLPIDIYSGYYHYRFKSQNIENNIKIIIWIDISNLFSKVPEINGGIYIKILKLPSLKCNKIFSIQRMKKIKDKNQNNLIQIKSKSQQNYVKQNNIKNGNKDKINLLSQNQIKTQILSEKQSTNTEENFLQFQKFEIKQQTIEQKVNFFNQIYNAEEQDKKNEQIAKNELQQQINNWGYTDGKRLNNLQTLISTLHIIWPQWNQISLLQLMIPQEVEIQFKKIVLKVHPDKNRNKCYKIKYIAKRVFQLLHQARRKNKDI